VSESESPRASAAFLYATLGALVFAVGCNRATPVVPPVREMAQVHLLAVMVGGKQFASIDVVNRATDFICIHKSFFEPEESTVYFVDEKGVEIRTQMPGDRFPKDRLGFDYRDSYYLLGPGEHLVLDYEIKDFHLVPGRYRYHIVMPFYVCRDIIDLGRIKKNVDARHLGITAVGEFEFK
jgi:hypothetical protein